MTIALQIVPGMDVVGADGRELGRVDHMDGPDVIKLARQDDRAEGLHHWIPLNWVSKIEGQTAHLRLSTTDAMNQWQAKD